jgi:hypothetical protein
VSSEGKLLGEMLGEGVGTAMGLALARSTNRRSAAIARSNLDSWKAYADELEQANAKWAEYAKRLENHIEFLKTHLVEKHLDLAGIAGVARAILEDLEANRAWPPTSCHIVRRKLFEEARKAQEPHCVDVNEILGPSGKWAGVPDVRYIRGNDWGPVLMEGERQRIRARAEHSAGGNLQSTPDGSNQACTWEARQIPASGLVREIATGDPKRSKAAYVYAAGERSLRGSADLAEMPVDAFEAYLRSLSIPITNEEPAAPPIRAQANDPADPGAVALITPIGSCPNCEAKIALESLECVHCKALFGPDSSWKVIRG